MTELKSKRQALMKYFRVGGNTSERESISSAFKNREKAGRRNIQLAGSAILDAPDPLGAMLVRVKRLVERRLAASARAAACAYEAISAGMRLVVNSAYAYLAECGELKRFADVRAANEETRRGRETLELMCR